MNQPFFDPSEQRALFKEVNSLFRNPIDFAKLIKRVNEMGSISKAGLDIGVLDSVQTQLYYKGYKIAKILTIVDRKGKRLPHGERILKGHMNAFSGNGQLLKATNMTPIKLKTRNLDIQKVFGMIRLKDEATLYGPDGKIAQRLGLAKKAAPKKVPVAKSKPKRKSN